MGKFGIFDVQSSEGVFGGNLLEVRHQDELLGYLKHLGGAKWKASPDGIEWSQVFIGYLFACHHLLKLKKGGQP